MAASLPTITTNPPRAPPSGSGSLSLSPLPLLGQMARAFSVGFGGLQYDTLVEMQEK